MSLFEDVFEGFTELCCGIKDATVELGEGLLEIIIEDLPADVADTTADIVATVGSTATVFASAAVVKNPIANLASSFIDNVFKEQVLPVEGSVVYCDVHSVEHSGIYVGDNQIVHLSGNGDVESVTPGEFIARLKGFNTAMSIYVSCKDYEAAGSQSAADRAIEEIGSSRNYNILMDNCHQFTAGCLTGDFESHVNFLCILKGEAKRILGADTWRVWELNSKELFG